MAKCIPGLIVATSITNEISLRAQKICDVAGQDVPEKNCPPGHVVLGPGVPRTAGPRTTCPPRTADPRTRRPP